MQKIKDSELEQATVRLFVAACAALYVLLVALLPGSELASFLPVLLYSGFFLIVSVQLRREIKKRPGHYPWRRVIEIFHDYTAITLALVIGGEVALPLFAVLLWVTVGNGLRFGRRYLLLATACALASLALAWGNTPMLQAHPFIGLALTLTVLAIPAYAWFLARDAHRAADQYAQLNTEQAQLLAQASHDIRHPIQSIGLFTASLRNSALNADQQRIVDNIDHSLVNMNQMFGHFLDQYRLDQGASQPAQAFDLQVLLHGLVRQNEAAAATAGVRLRLRPTRLWAHGDPTLLGRLLQNLLGNAIQYAPGCRVLLGVRRRGGQLAIEVHDQGPGMEPHHVARVFEEFYRIEPAASPGNGLGLSIARRLAEGMNLRIDLRSHLGRGTVVTLAPLTLAWPATGHAPYDLLAGLKVGWQADGSLQGVEALLRKWGCVLVAPPAPCEVLVGRVAQPGTLIPQVLLGVQGPRFASQNQAYLDLPINPAQLRSILLALRSAPAPLAITGS